MPIVEEVRTVTADGRLVVPWVIQRALGLEQGGPVRLSVANGVVTIVAASARNFETGRNADGATPRRFDIRTALMAEVEALLDTAERHRANEAATT
jgi:bifunctional DNA-binding transcriptional regulator/antitoxin component of YhaV-PrlF toxin-antitoxin module